MTDAETYSEENRYGLSLSYGRKSLILKRDDVNKMFPYTDERFATNNFVKIYDNVDGTYKLITKNTVDLSLLTAGEYTYEYPLDNMVLNMDCRDYDGGDTWKSRVGGYVFHAKNLTKRSDGGVYFNGASTCYAYSMDVPSFPNSGMIMFTAQMTKGSQSQMIVYNQSISISICAGITGTHWLYSCGASSNLLYASQTIDTTFFCGTTDYNFEDKNKYTTTYGIDYWYISYPNSTTIGGRLDSSGNANTDPLNGTIYNLIIYSSRLIDSKVNDAYETSAYLFPIVQ